MVAVPTINVGVGVDVLNKSPNRKPKNDSPVGVANMAANACWVRASPSGVTLGVWRWLGITSARGSCRQPRMAMGKTMPKIQIKMPINGMTRLCCDFWSNMFLFEYLLTPCQGCVWRIIP